ncbi:competence protein CoiA family protein [Pseudarthrobacter sp. SORGH_AS 212]|uniref:competence protein CoiA n=1 Tax=Pseudarthrobacter sp. SORGH_AS 212 TaxID=3041777 RepID=UPI0032B7D624
MLLTALLDGNRVDATAHTKESWAELQNSEDRKRMVMPVCGVRAVAKARGETTMFFAHLRKAGCKVDHGGETAQHLAMKEALKLCIDQVLGWHAIVEHPHPSREWIVDVLAEADDLTRRIAFEVQLSSQTPENYFARSQRYFDSGAFPVWLIPRQLESSQTIVPVVVTGFGKTSDVPDDVSALLALPANQNLVYADNNLGAFVEALLRRGPSWIHGSPQDQADTQKAAAEAADAAAAAGRRKQEAIEQAIVAMNDRSASPELAFGPHVVHTHTDTYVWGSLTCCWNCEEPMLVWDARIWAWGGGTPSLQVKPEVGGKRFENHPEVHRAVDNWIKAAKPDIPKAAIKPRRTKASGRLYSAFVCPSCDSTMGQIFISQIRSEKWSILSSPGGKLRPPSPVVKPSPAASPAPVPTPPIRVGVMPSPDRGARCGLHATPREWCAWCQNRQEPRLGKRVPTP